MMPITIAFSITNKHGVGITTMTAAPKKANISKNNHGNGDCSKNKKTMMMPKPTTTVEKNNSCQQKQQLRQQQNNNQQAANSKLQSTSTRVCSVQVAQMTCKCCERHKS